MQNSSFLSGIAEGQQVGAVYPNGPVGLPTPAVWSGNASSYVSLNPSGSFGQAYGVSQGKQVGRLFSAGTGHAVIWSGTAGSWVDLDSILPVNYSQSNALGVWTDGQTIQVAGYAYNNTLNRTEAILWTNTVPEPASFAFLAIGLPLLVLRRSLRSGARPNNARILMKKHGRQG